MGNITHNHAPYGKATQRECPICGKVFLRAPSQPGNYCSGKCLGMSQRKPIEQDETITKQCKNCEGTFALTEFYKSSRGQPKAVCKTCNKTRSTAWTKAHPERMRDIKKACDAKHANERYATYRHWYVANRDKLLAHSRIQSREWRRKNYVHHRAYNRQYEKDHPEEVKARALAWRNAHREQLNARGSAYKKAYPEKVREYAIRRRARVKFQTIGKADYALILAKHGYFCHICSEIILPSELQFDHVIPISRGGAHSAENIRPAHALCNRRKSDKLMHEL